MISKKSITLIKSKLCYFLAPLYVRVLVTMSLLLLGSVGFVSIVYNPSVVSVNRRPHVKIGSAYRKSVAAKLATMASAYDVKVTRMRVAAQTPRRAIIYAHVSGHSSDDVVRMMRDVSENFSHHLRPLRFSTHLTNNNQSIEARLWFESPIFR